MADERLASTRERWEKVEALFADARLLTPAEREPLLDRGCENDHALRRDVERLLAAHDDAGGLLDRFDAARAAALLIEEEAPGEEQTIGPYRIVAEIGRGGMGAVYLADRVDGQFDQRVALKLIKRGMDSEAILRRFLHERQILARLQHPNIARLYDGGVADDGRPFFAMEFVDGAPLTRYCDDRRLNVEQRLRLFMDVCRAVQYAHQNLVIHRDLKPSNMVVTEEGELKLLDFGIAKLLDEQGEDAASQTATGFWMMTPEYAAPEQVLGGAITTATDVYSLGVVLYELLTGHRPYRLDRRTPEALMRLFATSEPERPSAAVGRTEEVHHPDGSTTSISPAMVSRERGIPPDRLRRRLSGDLDVMVLKAMRREPERRYASVEAFLEDVDRHLSGLPVRALGDGLRYRASKFVRRHATGVLVSFAFVVVLVASAAALVVQQAETARERDKAEEVKEFVLSLFAVSDPNRSKGETVTARELLDQGALRIETELADQPAVRAEMTAVIGAVYRQLGLYDEALAAFEQSLELLRSTYGSAHAEVVTMLNEMGRIHFAKRELDEAEKLYREALDLGRKRLGPDHDIVAASLANLGSLFREQGRFDEAAKFYEESLAMRRRLFGDRNPRLAADLVNLGTALSDDGAYGEAEKQFREALAMRRAALGEEHTDVADALVRLGVVLGTKGAYEEAEATLGEALTLQQKLLGSDHPSIAETLHNLSVVLNNKGDYDEAISLSRAALALQRRTLGEEHRVVIEATLALAASLYNLERYPEAIEYAGQALDLLRKTLGEEHPQVAVSLMYLGTMYIEEGDLAAAEPLFLRAQVIAHRTLAEGHPLIADLKFNFGRLLLLQGRLTQAETSLREALRLHVDHFGPEATWTATTRAWLGRCLTARARFEEAEALLRKSLPVLEQQYGDAHKDTREAREALAELYAVWKRR